MHQPPRAKSQRHQRSLMDILKRRGLFVLLGVLLIQIATLVLTIPLSGTDQTGSLKPHPLEKVGSHGPAAKSKRNPSFRSWILLDNDREKVADSLERAVKYGVKEIQLSHNIIMDIDDIVENPTKAENVRLYTEWIHEKNMTSVVWAHEFHNVDPKSICFDPADPIWETRKDAYRKAFSIVPDIDGVVLMFGSAQVEPWYAVCMCDYCMENDTIPNPVHRSLRIPSPPERVKQITRMVHDVVVGELRKKLIIRTFIHRVIENEWIDEALRGLPDLDFVVMSKDVPQDFEPYYPDDWLFGRFSQPHIIEIDCAGEYWGQSVLPFAAPSYFERRFRHGAEKGVAGYTARVSRTGNSAFNTPNEINLLAASMFAENTMETTSEQVFDAFVHQRYGVSAQSDAGLALKKSLQYTFDVGRKMYYFLGFWALVKGSGLPSTLRLAELLFTRSVAKWDPDYMEYYAALTFPSTQTLLDLQQEKMEALYLNSESARFLDAAASALRPADYSDLSYRLKHQGYCTRVWKEVAELVWATRIYRQQRFGNQTAPEKVDDSLLLDYVKRYNPFETASYPTETELSHWIDISIKKMMNLADEIDRELDPTNVWPCEPSKIRELATDLRKTHPPVLRPVPRTQIQLSPPSIQISRGVVTVQFNTDTPVLAFVELGKKIPVYDIRIPSSDTPSARHVVLIDSLEPGQWYVLRIVATEPSSGLTYNGSDYWVPIRDTFSY